MLWRWETRVEADPEAVVGTAGLVGSGEVKALFEGVVGGGLGRLRDGGFG